MGVVKLLDCTLRDGGFVNDWEFGHDDIVNIFERLVSSGMDVIEVGFIDENRKFDMNRTIMPDTASINKVFEGLNPGNAMIVGMIDFGTCALENISPCSESFLDGIRVIFKQKHIHEAIEYCRMIKNKGYQLFVQPVSITGYSDEEMLELVNIVNELAPYAMSIVDTYGLLHKNNLKHYFNLIDQNLSPEIGIGYHSHNNFQLGYSNAIELITIETDRTITIDGSVYGMGKGAGNSNIELLSMYMNDNYGTNYDISQILELIDVSIMQWFLKFPWGYSLRYYLAALNDCHPKYVMYLTQKRTLSMKSINEILSTIETKKKLSFDQDHIDALYMDYQQKEIDDTKSLKKLSETLIGRPILIVGPGTSADKFSDKIQQYVGENKPVIISINYNPTKVDADFIFLSNAKRYIRLVNRLNSPDCNVKVIATSNVTRVNGTFDYTIEYSSLLDMDCSIIDNSLVMLLKVLIKIGVKEVNLAGFDGYTSNDTPNYFDMAMEYVFTDEQANDVNNYVINFISENSNELNVKFITPSLYFK